jgi:hypothetical protein
MRKRSALGAQGRFRSSSRNTSAARSRLWPTPVRKLAERAQRVMSGMR